MISLDTNVLVYISDDDEPEKQTIAREVLIVLTRVSACVGLQVIGELQNVLRRKLKHPSWLAAQTARNVLVAFDSFPATEANVQEALALMSSGRLGYWDALLLASARDAGVAVLLSEDMADGFRLGTIEVVNPFSSTGLSDHAREALKS